MRKSSVWVKSFILLFVLVLAVMAAFMIIVDPYFHYHGPVSKISYTLENPRYQNDGIVKHFEYDAIITGSSMTECFKTSDLESLFPVKAIKVPFSGGSYKEVNDLLTTAAKSQPNLRMVVRGLDCNRFFNSKDDMDYEDYPYYLYDNNPFNDVSYLFNKEILLTAVQDLIGINADGAISMSFDDYCNWTNYFKFGKDVVDDYYRRETLEPFSGMNPITDEDYAKIDANIKQNVTDLADAYPNIDFYLFFTPYSIYYMDYWYQTGELERQLLAEKHITELLLQHENIHLYSFSDKHEVINNLDNYRDVAHYSGEINTEILNWIADGEGLLTSENYEEHWQQQWDYYMNFDYEALFTVNE